METTTITPRSAPKPFLYITGVLLGLVMLASAIFLGFGGKVNVIETPSMATYTPVGSLVLTMPTAYDALQAGDTILFNVAEGEKAYFHRVMEVTANGLVTQGDLNGTIDPWLVTEQNVLGKEVFHAFGLGFLFMMLPALVIGSILIYLITYFYFPGYWKVPLRIFGGTLLASIVNYLYHPFVNVSVLSQVVEEGVATTKFVPTGLWALDGTAYEGTSALNVKPGEVGTITSSVPDANDQFSVDIIPHMEPWVWFVMYALWVIPALLSAGYYFYARAKGLDVIPEEPEESQETTDGEEQTQTAASIQGVSQSV